MSPRGKPRCRATATSFEKLGAQAWCPEHPRCMATVQGRDLSSDDDRGKSLLFGIFVNRPRLAWRLRQKTHEDARLAGSAMIADRLERSIRLAAADALL